MNYIISEEISFENKNIENKNSIRNDKEENLVFLKNSDKVDRRNGDSYVPPHENEAPVTQTNLVVSKVNHDYGHDIEENRPVKDISYNHNIKDGKTATQTLDATTYLHRHMSGYEHHKNKKLEHEYYKHHKGKIPRPDFHSHHADVHNLENSFPNKDNTKKIQDTQYHQHHKGDHDCVSKHVYIEEDKSIETPHNGGGHGDKKEDLSTHKETVKEVTTTSSTSTTSHHEKSSSGAQDYKHQRAEGHISDHGFNKHESHSAEGQIDHHGIGKHENHRAKENIGNYEVSEHKKDNGLGHIIHNGNREHENHKAEGHIGHHANRENENHKVEGHIGHQANREHENDKVEGHIGHHANRENENHYAEGQIGHHGNTEHENHNAEGHIAHHGNREHENHNTKGHIGHHGNREHENRRAEGHIGHHGNIEHENHKAEGHIGHHGNREHVIKQYDTNENSRDTQSAPQKINKFENWNDEEYHRKDNDYHNYINSVHTYHNPTDPTIIGPSDNPLSSRSEIKNLEIEKTNNISKKEKLEIVQEASLTIPAMIPDSGKLQLMSDSKQINLKLDKVETLEKEISNGNTRILTYLFIIIFLIAFCLIINDYHKTLNKNKKFYHGEYELFESKVDPNRENYLIPERSTLRDI